MTWKTVQAVGLTVLRGTAIGAANLIPGVSGGTLAVILGIYERLIEAISGLLRFDSGWRGRLFFLLQVGGGALVAILLFARLIGVLLEHQPIPTGFFFVGLVLGSIPHLWRHLRRAQAVPSAARSTRSAPARSIVRPAVILPILGGLIIPTVLTFIPTVARDIGALGGGDVLLLFVSGIAGAAAMALPGISGSFVLLLIGTYSAVLDALRTLDLAVMALVGLGVVVGLGVISGVIRHLLARWPSPTFAALFGLVLGSIVKIWPGLPTDWGTIGLAAAALVIGLVPALLCGGTAR